MDSGISEPEATTWTPSTSCMLGHFLSFGVVVVQSSNYLRTCVSGFGFFFFLNQRECISFFIVHECYTNDSNCAEFCSHFPAISCDVLSLLCSLRLIVNSPVL